MMNSLREELQRLSETCVCPIWKEAIDTVTASKGRRHESEPCNSYYSPRAGGVFRIHDDALYPDHAPQRGTEFFEDNRTLQLSENMQVRISRWILDNNERGEVPMLDQAEIERLVNLPPLRMEQRIERLLIRFNRHRIAAGVNLRRNSIYDEDPTIALFQAATECWGEDDLDWLLREVDALGLLREVSPGTKTFVLTAGGVERLEAAAQPSSKQGFVAMWFDASTSDAYDHGIKPGIEDAGYEARRIDEKEHNNKIDDEIIAEIRRSRFVVADFTCGTVPHEGKKVAIPRGGVYYEAGFAQGLNVPLIWTCHEGQVDQLHFDTRQYSHILWTDPQDLRHRLRNKIGAVIGDGPLRKG